MKTIAFIPVRGGSRGIPGKNIKLFCGKPLVLWVVDSLAASEKVDKIVIATDSEDIKKVVRSRSISNLEIYDRDPENARDESSTESVMLEYIQKAGLSDDDIFMLVQATSPFTQTIHFDRALDMFSKADYSSVLSCVKSTRFFWNRSGVPLNYDYLSRPRRQEMDTLFMENGAIYINNVKNIKLHRNRLSPDIGIFEMPEYTGIELDEEDDWLFAEYIMSHIPRNNRIYMV